MRIDRRSVTILAPLALIALSPGTTRTAAEGEATPIQTVGTWPAGLTTAEMEKLIAADPAAWARLQESLALPMGAEIVPQPVVPVVVNGEEGGSVSGILEKDGPVRTIVIGPAGLTEQEFKKLQEGAQVPRESR